MKHFFILLFLTSIFSSLQAQPGTLDKSFGEGGKVISTTYGGEIYSSALQPDGKIVVGGVGSYGNKKDGALLARYNTDGTLDLSFGDSGRVVYNFINPAYPKYAYSLAVQKDGKIVAAVRGYNSFAVMRINTDGTVDKSFGEGGLALGSEDQGYIDEDMAILPDGRIILAGEVHNDINDDNRSFLACFTADGRLDKNFGKGGIIITVFNSAINISTIAITLKGDIVIGGIFRFENKIILLRYNDKGEADKSFGDNGIAAIPFDLRFTTPGINDIAIAADNTIATAGEVYPNNSINASLLISRFNENGKPDSSFGTNGYTITDYKNADAHADAVAVQQNGKIVAGGYILEGETAGFTTARYNNDGTIDSSFGENGIVTTYIYKQEEGHSLLIQKDGKIVLIGSTILLSEDRYIGAYVRYNGDEQGKQPMMVRIKRWMLHHGISWQMQPNKAVRYYAVQRSADGIVYKEIAKLSNKQQVDKYEDASILAGSSYYRLAAIGWDGSRTYSNTVLIDESTNVKVFPNPVRDNLQLQGLQSGKTSVSIVDLQGNVRSSAVAAGANYSVNTSQLTPGNYLLKLQHNSTTTTQPFVKE